MAEKKKSVAEILAAARKSDAGRRERLEGGAAETPQAAPPAKAPAPPRPAATAGGPASSSAGGPASSSAGGPAKPAAPGGKPSVADILAAARAGAKGGEATPQPSAGGPASSPAGGPAKPAAKPAAAVKSAPAAPGPPKDTSSILAAARAASRPGPMSKAEAAEKGLAKPAAAKEEKARRAVAPMPVKPEYAKPKPAKAATEERRGMLGLLFGSAMATGFTSLAGTFGLWTLGTARFMFPNILTEPPSRFKVGFPSNFAPGQVETKFIPQFGVWIVNGEYNGQAQIYALRSVCTHLGCTPNWLEGEQKFKCPCHGSGFYKDGINFEGPAPRPLERYAIRLADDGQLEVDKSKMYQEEMGQWSDPASFVPT